MILSEEGAKQKWCPFSRVIFNDAGRNKDGDRIAPPYAASYNRSSDPVALSNCLGSGCMAWVWAEASDAPNRRGSCGLTEHRTTSITSFDGLGDPTPPPPIDAEDIKAAAARGASRAKKKV